MIHLFRRTILQKETYLIFKWTRALRAVAGIDDGERHLYGNEHGSKCVLS